MTKKVYSPPSAQVVFPSGDMLEHWSVIDRNCDKTSTQVGNEMLIDWFIQEQTKSSINMDEIKNILLTRLLKIYIGIVDYWMDTDGNEHTTLKENVTIKRMN